MNTIGRTIEEIKIAVDRAPQVPHSQDAPGLSEASEPQRPKRDHPIRVQIQREVLNLETPDCIEVERSVGHIFLDLLEMRLMDVHALQKATVAEIIIRGSTLSKQVKQSNKAINKIKEKRQRTKQKVREEE